MKSILLGLKALYSTGIAHRDIKPQNIMFAKQEKIFILIDYGECLEVPKNQISTLLKKNPQIKEIRGSPFFLEPVMLEGY